ncbi:hypothetical protein FRC06_009082, partial [Ceratobasidium sp. 370]
LVDWQFHTIWVDMKHLRPGEELDTLQTMVQSTLRPKHCGKPPHGLGTSGAGSLTADPLRSLATIDLPLAIPVLWDSVNIDSVAQRAHEEWAHHKEIEENKKKEARKARSTREQAKRKRKEDCSSDSEEIPADARVLAEATEAAERDEREHSLLSWRKQDAEGVLLLASAIKSLCARTVRKENIKKGEEYLKRYLVQSAQLRGAERIHPNHHFALHMPAQLLRYGPMHQIWAYSGECLNYTLKSTNNNSRGGGERELTFATAFHYRRAGIDRLSKIAAHKEDSLSDWAKYMLGLDHLDLRGTAATEALDSQGGWFNSLRHNEWP